MVAVVGGCVAAVAILLFWVPIPRSTSTGARSFRPLLGTPYRAISPISRGTIADVFAHTSDESTLTPVSDEPPSVTTDIGSGPVDAPSSQATLTSQPVIQPTVVPAPPVVGSPTSR
jgi:hypothetical protein